MTANRTAFTLILPAILLLCPGALKSQGSLSGFVFYANVSQSPLDYIPVYLVEDDQGSIVDSVYTGADGFYLFENPGPGTYRVVPACDKGWHGANGADALQVMQHFVGMIQLTGTALRAADVNAVPPANTVDALQIMKRFTGMQNDFPVGNWVYGDDTVSIDGTGDFTLSLDALCAGDVNGSHLPLPSPCPPVLYEGKLYHGVQIGSQCWMRENLNVGIMVLDHYTGSLHGHAGNNGVIEKYCYDNSPASCDIWGGLYDWDELMNYDTTPGSQGICPPGWHVPTDAEYCILTTYLDPSTNCGALGYSGTNAAGKMKEPGLVHWNAPNTGASNESGFTAWAAGYRFTSGYTNSIFQGAYFWTSSADSPAQAITRNLGMYNANISRFHYAKKYGFSVRCLKD